MQDTNDTVLAVSQIKIKGGLTISQAREQKARILEGCCNAEAVNVDLAEVSDIDTAGLQLLLALKLRPISVTFTNPSPVLLQAAELFNLSGLLFNGTQHEEN